MGILPFFVFLFALTLLLILAGRAYDIILLVEPCGFDCLKLLFWRLILCLCSKRFHFFDF
jgi:hypothetical protein